jgi:predicted small lipoprotein YifL
VILLSVAALALGACGRKGPLDLPPTSSSSSQPSASSQPDGERAKPSLFDPSFGADAGPTAPKGTKKPFLLDPLLGN